MLKQLSVAFAALVCLTACAGDKQEVVVIRTSMGEIVFAFYKSIVDACGDIGSDIGARSDRTCGPFQER